MLGLILFFICFFCTLGMGVLAALSDLRGFTIPNIYSVIIIVSFFAAYLITYVSGNHAHVFMPVKLHIIAGVLVFIVTFTMFQIGAIGGGDSKLVTAFAFWVGIKGLIPFLFYMSLIGGLMGVFSLFLRVKKPFKSPKAGTWIAASQAGENKIPYGLAIVCGALASFVVLGYLGLDTFVSFFAE